MQALTRVAGPTVLVLAGAVTLIALASGGVGAQGRDSIWTVGETGLQIQNVDSTDPAEILAEFYDFDGHLTHAFSRDLGPGAATNFYLPKIERDLGLVPQSYALIVSASRPAVGLSRTEDRTTGAALLYTNIPPDTDIVVPLITKAFANQNSLVSIQNTDPYAPNRLDIAIMRAGESVPIHSYSLTVPPAGSALVDFWRGTDVAAVPNGFVGWMRVRGERPLVAQTSVHQATSAQAVAAFEGSPATTASATLYVPLFRSAWYGTTGIAVVNPSSSAASSVQVTYYGTLGACAGQTYTQGPVPVAPGGGLVFFQGPGDIPYTGPSPLPDNCAGAAIVEATDAGVLGAIMDLDSVHLPHTAAAYSAVTPAGTGLRLAAPLVRNHHTAADLISGIQVMNVDPARSATVRLSLVDSDGIPVPGGADQQGIVPPHSARTWYLPSLSGLAHRRNLFGSAILESDVPIAAVVVESSLNGRSDTAAYTAIPTGAVSVGNRAGHLGLQWLSTPGRGYVDRTWADHRTGGRSP